jgi:hypothetical protein
MRVPHRSRPPLRRGSSPYNRPAIKSWSAAEEPYLRIKYINQLAPIVIPTNNTQQYTPNRAMAFGVTRCVIPNTTEVNVANNNTAVK